MVNVEARVWVYTAGTHTNYPVAGMHPAGSCKWWRAEEDWALCISKVACSRPLTARTRFPSRVSGEWERWIETRVIRSMIRDLANEICHAPDVLALVKDALFALTAS